MSERDVRCWLRDRTRDDHARVDAAPVMLALMAGRLPLPAYRRLLEALRQLFLRLERDHAAVLAVAATRGWTWTSRAALLAQDLGVVHEATPADRTDSDAAIDAATLAAGWGALYVIEGSTLGARLISAQLRRSFPDGVPLRYFSHGADEPAHWPRFLRVLERELADPATHADALAGARATFAAFSRTLEALA